MGEIMDVPEVSWITDSNTSLPPESVPKDLIPTPPKTDLAKSLSAPKTLSPFHHTLMSLKDPPPPLNKDVTNNQFPLLVMPKTGLLIPVVSSPTVEHPSITEFYSLETPVVLPIPHQPHHDQLTKLIAKLLIRV